MASFGPELSLFRRRRLPVVLQTEAAECALACLVMVACYWGYQIDIATLRRRFSVSLKGTTLKDMVALASRLELTSRPLKLDLAQVTDLELPCVLHWDMTHFVVLKQATRQHVVIHDPAVGERRLAIQAFSEHFTGIALELSPGQAFRRTLASPRVPLTALMGRLRGITRGLVQLLVLGLALQVFALCLPLYLQWLVDQALLSGDRSLVHVLGLGFLLLVVVQTSITAVRSWLTTVLSTNINYQWLGNVFAHLLQLPLDYFEKRHLGDIVSRFGSIQTIQRALTTQLIDGLIDGALVVFTLVLMFIYSMQLALVALFAVLLYLLLRGALFARLRSATSEQIIHQARQSSFFLASARGIQSIRLFGRAEERRQGWLNLLADQFNAELRIARLAVSYQTASTLLFSVERIAVIWLAALAVLDTRFTVGMLFAFLSYQDQFSQRTGALIDRMFEMRMLRLHGERVADIVFTEPEREVETLVDPAELEASIGCRNIAFRYADGDPLLFHDLSLEIPPGQCIAITGASGSGKTTLAKLLLGLLEAQDGEIEMGGVPVTQIGFAKVRSQIGTVMQDDLLFAGSIADNISFFDPEPELKRVVQCAVQVGLQKEIESMPMSYDTLVGDIGQGLSGGQRQRVLLARALYKEPRILILDEATSQLDVNSEQAVNRAIRTLSLTRIVIAHRPDTIAMAERIVVLDQGRIVSDMLNPSNAQDAPQSASNMS